MKENIEESKKLKEELDAKVLELEETIQKDREYFQAELKKVLNLSTQVESIAGKIDEMVNKKDKISYSQLADYAKNKLPGDKIHIVLESPLEINVLSGVQEKDYLSVHYIQEESGRALIKGIDYTITNINQKDASIVLDEVLLKEKSTILIVGFKKGA